MSFSDLADVLREIANYSIFMISGTEISLLNLAAFALVVLLSVLVARLLSRSADAALTRRDIGDPETRELTTRLINLVVVTVGIATGLTSVGIGPDTLVTVLNFSLFKISGEEISLVNLATVGLIVLLTLLASRLLQRSAEVAMDRRDIQDPGTRAIATRLINIGVMSVGIAAALENAGVNLGALFAAGAVFAVGISFAFQSVAQNFISGLILLLERAIKPGDVLEVDGKVVRVEKLGIRSTVGRTRDDEQIIIPNTILAQGTVKNYTMEDSLYRVRVAVGVTYDSDMELVRRSLEEVVGHEKWGVTARDPVVLMTAFGNSSVDFDVSIWTDDPWGAPRVRSNLHEAVWWALADAGVVIAFPQLDVHFDPPVEEAFTRFPRAS